MTSINIDGKTTGAMIEIMKNLRRQGHDPHIDSTDPTHYIIVY
jgi:hypothetical protein